MRRFPCPMRSYSQFIDRAVWCGQMCSSDDFCNFFTVSDSTQDVGCQRAMSCTHSTTGAASGTSFTFQKIGGQKKIYHSVEAVEVCQDLCTSTLEMPCEALMYVHSGRSCQLFNEWGLTGEYWSRIMRTPQVNFDTGEFPGSVTVMRRVPCGTVAEDRLRTTFQSASRHA